MPTPQLRVLQLHPRDTLGGTELMIVNLAPRLRRLGIECEHATFDRPGPIAAHLHSAGVPSFALAARGPALARKLGQLLRAREYDLVNAYGFRASLLTRLLLPLAEARARVVVGVQGLSVTEVEDLDALKARFVDAVERVSWRLVDAYEANSEGAIERLARAGIPRRLLHFVPNGIDTEKWRMRDGQPTGVPLRIVCAARFVPRKRQIDLINAAERLVREGLEVHLDLVGEGPTLPSIRARAERGTLKHRATFHGALRPEDVPILLERSAVFCLPSTWEGMPAAVLEAMACGVPVVGTRVNGINELIAPGHTGLSVPVRRPDLLAAALRRVLTDRPLATRMAAAARAAVEQRYSVDRMVGAKAALYREVATGFR